MVLYRSHRGGLADSMNTVVDVSDAAELVKHINEDVRLGPGIAASDITAAPYGYDDRIGWDTHIVTRRDGKGVYGFTNGAVVGLQ